MKINLYWIPSTERGLVIDEEPEPEIVPGSTIAVREAMQHVFGIFDNLLLTIKDSAELFAMAAVWKEERDNRKADPLYTLLDQEANPYSVLFKAVMQNGAIRVSWKYEEEE